MKYTFERPTSFYQSQTPGNLGKKMGFEVKGNKLSIKSPEGFVVNTLKIIRVSENELILVQPGVYGLEDPKALLYRFSREQDVLKTILLDENSVYKNQTGDTVYKQSSKVFAVYKGGDFEDDLRVGDGDFMTGKSGHLVASFLVGKNGKVDSLKIIKSISPAYDKLFIKEFNRFKKDWKPATIDGKPVNVEMNCEKRYLKSEDALPALMYSMNAGDLFRAQEYAGALEQYNLALALRPDDIDGLYCRSICYKSLGNMEKACADWKTIARLGSQVSKKLLEKYCK
ncbi:energy transducer TonB [Pedobacter ginsengisoli]|uniref:energy transducer TonB n=1 Tax=Pedobacter ginsengisoli TaxID=363852 RepID=UPI00254D0E2A|nr:energy transducer TonB [Pedobacter ginsengisoli]